ncbi:YopX family protein [Staphylococcus saprophyticus]|nr:YopX family protein [Staphylococcus saprophyticus]
MIPKFRAWDKQECEFVPYLRNIVLKHDGTIEGIEYEMPHEGIVYNDISYFELMQSTGLKDKHGVEIYDKDIVRDSYGDILLIEWLDDGFVLTDFFSGGYDHCNIDDSELYEVIGNKYEHPHLLEE